MTTGSFLSYLFSGSLLLACFSLSLACGAAERKPDPKNGERVYYTATSTTGNPITYTGGPDFGGRMMGSYLTCAACHGPEGHGGLHKMQMASFNAPDIRLSTLNALPEIQALNKPFGLDEFKLAVEGGKDAAGAALDPNMPRWSMSDADLQDLFAFIKTLQ